MTGLKTANEIEDDFRAMVLGSAIGAAIHGSVLVGWRPPDAATEDCVLSFISGLDERVQTGIVVLNIYVPDSSTGVADHGRIGIMQRAVLDFVRDDASEYRITTEQTPAVERIEDIGQSCVVARLRFYRAAR